MMYTSRDRNFTERFDYRFTQYRCPSCFSYRVAIKSVANWPDASAIVALGEGEMECQDCKIVKNGKDFQIDTRSHSDNATLLQIMQDAMQATGDQWTELRCKN